MSHSSETELIPEIEMFVDSSGTNIPFNIHTYTHTHNIHNIRVYVYRGRHSLTKQVWAKM